MPREQTSLSYIIFVSRTKVYRSSLERHFVLAYAWHALFALMNILAAAVVILYFVSFGNLFCLVGPIHFYKFEKRIPQVFQ